MELLSKTCIKLFGTQIGYRSIYIKKFAIWFLDSFFEFNHVVDHNLHFPELHLINQRTSSVSQD